MVIKNCGKAVVAALTAIVVTTLFAGNEANPDAIELVPLPQPVEFKSDIDRPVVFDETVRVVVDCPDGFAAPWLDAHLKEWYGKFAPKSCSRAAGTLPLP